MRIHAIALSCLAWVACADRSLGTPSDSTTQQPNTTTVSCAGYSVGCVMACGDDGISAEASCQDGDWVCPSPYHRIDQCPKNTCWGAPLPGEVCSDDNGWVCAPGPDVYVTCPGLICAECSGFPSAVTMGECTCACTEMGQVQCYRSFPPPGPLDPGARFYGSFSSGFAGLGKAVEILGDGTVHGWNYGTDPQMRAPDFTDTIPISDVADLFTRYHAVDRSALPHGGAWAECYVSGLVRDCASCADAVLDYSTSNQVVPEMQPVWKWFDEHARDSISVSDFNPEWYCPGGD
jgi:hypothetical protein